MLPYLSHVQDADTIAVCFVTLGCAKNEVDSDAMAMRLREDGIEVIDDASQANCIIINTCSFIQAATEESLAAIFDAADMENVAQGKSKIVVAGCMPARYGFDLEEELSEASAFVPCDKEDDIAQVVRSLFPEKGHKTYGADTHKSPSRYVKISDGCDRYCSFCTIPFIRGRYRSFPFERIEHDVSAACETGAAEIVLIAQDTGRWGSDLGGEQTLAWLVEQLAKLHPQTWFRVMYVQPEGITDELLQVIARYPNVCPYLDIPFQHCNEDILYSMNRKGTASTYLELVAHIREMIPDVTIRTTLIAGYPGETDEAFQELLAFVESADLDYVGVFPYSCEDGTRAAELKNQIDEVTKLERAQQLRDVADSLSHARIAQRVGSSMDVLVLGCEEDGQLFGRAMCQAPDVDGVVYVDRGTPGQVIQVTISDTLLYEMEGE